MQALQAPMRLSSFARRASRAKGLRVAMEGPTLRDSPSLTAVLLACLGLTVACGNESPSALPTGRSVTAATETLVTPTVSATPRATPRPETIDRSKLPIEVGVPGAPDDVSTPVDASEYDYGDYLHVVDLSIGTAELVASAPPAPKTDIYELPALSPDHTQVAYRGGKDVAIVDLASGRVRAFPLPTSLPTTSPCQAGRSVLSWAPDSVRLAVNTETALLVLQTGSGAFQEIAQNRGTPGSCGVAWSPEGQWIVFASAWRLALVRPDGSDRRDVPVDSPARASYYGGPSTFIWAPDSAHFFFSGMTLIPDKGYASMSFVSALDLRATGIPIGDSIAWQTPPMMHDVHELPFIEALSVSGTRAAYLRTDHDENWKWTNYLETRNLDGTNGQTLVTYISGGGSIRDVPVWSPDDSLIAYPDRPAGQPYQGSVRIVTSTGGEDLAAVRGPESFRLVNGRWVVCTMGVVGWLSQARLLTWTTCEGSI